MGPHLVDMSVCALQAFTFPDLSDWHGGQLHRCLQMYIVLDAPCLIWSGRSYGRQAPTEHAVQVLEDAIK